MDDLTLPSLGKLPSKSSPASTPTTGQYENHDSDANLQKKISLTWSKVVANYTKRRVTDPVDRLIALSGVARAIHNTWWPQSTYLAGLWSHNLAQDVLWRKLTPSRPYTGKYRAPSWAATDGKVESSHTWPPMVNGLWTVKGAEVEPEVPGIHFAGIKEGCKIVIEAAVRKVGWDARNEDDQFLVSAKGRRIGQNIGLAYMDTTECVKREGWAVVVGENRGTIRNLYGLLVVEVEANAETESVVFKRVGMFNVHERIQDEGWEDDPWDDLEEWMATDKRVITII